MAETLTHFYLSRRQDLYFFLLISETSFYMRLSLNVKLVLQRTFSHFNVLVFSWSLRTSPTVTFISTLIK